MSTSSKKSAAAAPLKSGKGLSGTIPDESILRSSKSLPKTTLDDILGCLKYEGPAKTLEEMEAGIAEGARQNR
jgi:hypothetical protein